MHGCAGADERGWPRKAIASRGARGLVAIPANVLLALALGGCPSPGHAPSGFDGRQTESWIAFDLEYAAGAPVDLFSPFDARAQALGCRTEWISTHITYHHVGYGIAAHCAEGSIALLGWPGDRIRIGCSRPTTRDRCEGLLKEISEGRSQSSHAAGP